MMSEPEENRLDQTLRSKFEDFDLPPGAPVWAGIAQRLPPPPQLRPRRRPGLVPLLWVLTALVAGLGGWLLPRAAMKPGAHPQLSRVPATAAGTTPQLSSVPATAAGTTRQLSRVPATAAGTTRQLSSVPLAAAGTTRQLSSVPLAAASTTRQPSGVAISLTDTLRQTSGVVVVADGTPATLRPLAALERQTLGQLPSIATLAAGPLEAASRAAFIGTLRTERAELFRLQRRTDSLLLALGDLPGAVPVAQTDTAQAPKTQSPTPKASKWSILLAATPEQNTLALLGPEGDSLTALRRNHETGRAGLSAALLAEYRLTPRLSVGGGVGYTTFGADLRITNKTTDVRVAYNTTTSTSTRDFTSSYQTHSIRIVQVPQLSPVFNGSGQVIRYDTVYVPRQDTVFTTTVQHDTVRTTVHTTTPTITRKETLTTKLLQPNYRFFTVPVLLRYRLAAPGSSRLWTDVAVGAQLQFFLGGTQVVTNDGENFRTEQITAGTGPFRALNVALAGSLALNYALTNRLSVSVAPSMRWQALSLYKPETGLRQQATSTGLMLGVRFGL